MTKKQEKAIQTKQKLIEATIKLLENKSFTELLVEDITSTCGCAKGTFYTYFNHKEDICYEICRGLFKKIELDMQNMKDKSFTERMRYYFEQFILEIERYGINICREWIKGVIDPGTAPANMDKQKWHYDTQMLQQILQTAIKEHELNPDTPVELLTHIIIAELYGMMTCWCMSDNTFVPSQWSNHFFETAIKPTLQNYIAKK